MNAKHSSQTNEHMTPEYIVVPARDTLGGFDLDPASNTRANKVVKAHRIFTKEDDGLHQEWVAHRVFLNPPGGLVDSKGFPVIRASRRGGIEACTKTGACGLPVGHKHTGVMSSMVYWWWKLMNEVKLGNVHHAIFLGFSIEFLQTAQRIDCVQPVAYPLCIPRDRIPFDTFQGEVRVPGTQPTHANVIVCVTSDPGVEASFCDHFRGIGSVFNRKLT